MNPETTAAVSYETPSLRVLGSVAELTQMCDKKYGSSDGHTFMGTNIVCVSG